MIIRHYDSLGIERREYISMFEKLLFTCDNKGITISDEDHKKQIVEFIKQNHDPGLSLTAKVEQEDANMIKITDGKKNCFLKLDNNKRKVSLQNGNRKDEFIIAKTVPKENGKEDYYIYPRDILQGPCHEFVGPSGIILTTIYLFCCPY